MPRTVWETRENNGEWVVSGWDLPKDVHARLDAKLDQLRQAEVDPAGKVLLPTGMFAGPVYKTKWIYKLIINGRQALRPMLCLGPLDRDREWTILARATKKDNDTGPEKAAAGVATVRRSEILRGVRGRQVFVEADDDSPS